MRKTGAGGFHADFCCPLIPNEISWSLEFVNGYERQLQAAGNVPEQVPLRSWQALCRALFMTNEFLFVD